MIAEELFFQKMGTLYDTAAVTYAFPWRWIVVFTGGPYCAEHGARTSSQGTIFVERGVGELGL